MGVRETDPLSQLSLPPGFRFYPTDEELLVQYLCRKVAGHQFSLQIIGEIDLYKYHPWDLPSKAVFGAKEWYFFSPRERKYPNGSRPNRVAGSGFWKATGTDKLDDWVLCRIYKKNSSEQKVTASGVHSQDYSMASSSSSTSQYDDVLDSMPEIDHRFISLEEQKLNLQQLGSGNFDWATLAGLYPLPELGPPQQGLTQQLGASFQNDIYAPPSYHVGGNVVDEEVQSGIRAQRVGQPGFLSFNGGASSRGFASSVEPSLVRDPNRFGGFGFKQ